MYLKTMSDSETEKLINDEGTRTGSYETTIRPILAEFVGVCLFVFIGCMASQNQLLTAVALAHGLTIALLIIGLGAISGGHFNPAVTLGVTLAGAIKPALALGYFLAQLLGGLVGAAFVRAVLPSDIYTQTKGGIHSLGHNVDPGWAILGEVILTTVLVFTVLMSAVNRTTKSNLAPLAIGFAVAVDIMSGGPTTGASMNPARALGPALVSSAVVSDSFDDHYVWWVGPLLGGLVAGLLYSDFRRLWVDQEENDTRIYHNQTDASLEVFNVSTAHGRAFWDTDPLLLKLINQLLFASSDRRWTARPSI